MRIHSRAITFHLVISHENCFLCNGARLIKRNQLTIITTNASGNGAYKDI